MSLTIFDELLGYVGFGPADGEALRRFHPVAEPHFMRIAEAFYRRILDHPDARRALEGGESQVGRLQVTLVDWMDTLLRGPWDAAYFERRCRIGRIHVRIALPQHYMFGGMNLLRRGLGEVADTAYAQDAPSGRAVHAALDRILDVELGVMLHTYREDHEAQRMTAVRTLTAGLSHEIRNPLNAASLQLAVLERRLRRLPSAEQAGPLEPLALVREEIRRLDHLLEDFLQFARPRAMGQEPVPMEPLVAQVADLLATDAERRGVRLRLELERGLEARGEESRLREVVMNLVLNALDASPRGAEVRVAIFKVSADLLELRVDDQGPGVSQELRERIFQPFFTTKAGGSGLGLAIVQSIVGQHGGSVRLETSDQGGASFRIRLPVA
jgi:two-component system, NtrC family, sensor histidine kinase HydH